MQANEIAIVPRSVETPALAIVQSHVTQFDDPFFRFLEAENAFRLTVFYTTRGDALKPFDPEIDRYPDWTQDAERGYSFRVYPRSHLSRVRTSVALVRARPDLIIISGWRSFDNLLILALAWFARIPLGLRADNCPSAEKPSLAAACRRFIRRMIFRLFSTGHPVGSLAERYMIESGLAPDRVFRFPYAIDEGFLTGRYSRALAERSSIRSDYGIGSNDFVVMGVMKFVEREDPLTLLKAFAAAFPFSWQSRAHLILVGDGDLRTEVERFLKQKGLDTVHLTGYVPYGKLPSLFAMADVLVHPARQESWGVTVNEALVCGLPVIAADSVGSAPDLIESGVNGFTFPAGDEGALTSLLTMLWRQPAALAALKNNCRLSPKLARFAYPAVRDSLLDALRFVSKNS
jgi:glycosyltransferase involved in cell wall biosynthesis